MICPRCQWPMMTVEVPSGYLSHCVRPRPWRRCPTVLTVRTGALAEALEQFRVVPYDTVVLVGTGASSVVSRGNTFGRLPTGGRDDERTD